MLLDGSDSSYAMWRNTNDTLRKHLGDLHYRTNKKGVEGISDSNQTVTVLKIENKKCWLWCGESCIGILTEME